ncbi:MAG: nucleoside hydrolase [Erysipelotrichaceae bacterium]|nr:nucleoside hydrolase [Erysipelotrichaceae bacterium]
MTKRKIILDCDPGHDDAVAIMMAARHPAIELLGMTIVAGNQTLQKNVRNALNICQHLDLDVKVYAGCDRPLVVEERHAGDIHGQTGLDGPVFQPLIRKTEDKHAVLYIIDELMHADEKITVVAIGPLTNIAMAIRLQPAIIEKIDQLVIMGGSITDGNVTPAAEFNIYADREAARIVFNSGLDIVMCGLDVTRKAACTQQVIDSMAALNNKAGYLFRDMLEVYNRNQNRVFGITAGPLHDPVTIAWLIDSSVLTLKECYVDIETTGYSYGRTNCDFYWKAKKANNARVAVDIDVDRFWQIIRECLSLY